MEYLHNNTVQQLQEQDHIDCCFMAILSWGRPFGAHLLRELMEQSPPNPSRPVPTAEELQDPYRAPRDFDVKQSVRVLHMDNKDFWFRENDTDWHLPILVTLREATRKNWRQMGGQREINQQLKKPETQGEHGSQYHTRFP